MFQFKWVLLLLLLLLLPPPPLLLGCRRRCSPLLPPLPRPHAPLLSSPSLPPAACITETGPK